MVLHQPTNYDFSEQISVMFMMFVVLFKLLFIYISTAATFFFFIALDAAVTSFPQRTNTLFFFF